MIKISIRNHNIYISKNFTIFVFIRQKSILFYSKFPILNVQPFETLVVRTSIRDSAARICINLAHCKRAARIARIVHELQK